MVEQGDLMCIMRALKGKKRNRLKKGNFRKMKSLELKGT